MADFIQLSDLLSQVNWETVTEENSFEDLPEGFYLCEVEKAELKENKAKTNMQVSFRFNVVDNGLAEKLDAKGNSVLVENSGTKGRKVFKHYAFKDAASVKRFVNDMLKFEDPSTPGEPILSVDYFTMEETFPDALGVIESMQLRLYIQARYTERDGKKTCWYDLISWKRAAEMGLPV